jgi:hypothetical protein
VDLLPALATFSSARQLPSSCAGCARSSAATAYVKLAPLRRDSVATYLEIAQDA